MDGFGQASPTGTFSEANEINGLTDSISCLVNELAWLRVRTAEGKEPSLARWKTGAFGIHEAYREGSGLQAR
jgi:hypothetical protein